jgi:uncharacterized protein YycO
MDIPLGSILLTAVDGPAQAAIRLGQWLNGDPSVYTHAGVTIGGMDMVEARPGGAGIRRIDAYRDGRQLRVAWSPTLPDAQRQAIVDEARALIGTPYSWADYASLALEHFRVRPPWVRDRVAGSGSMICSQLVDAAYQRAGVQLFDDGRLSGDVTPGDLARMVAERGWHTWGG